METDYSSTRRTKTSSTSSSAVVDLLISSSDILWLACVNWNMGETCSKVQQPLEPRLTDDEGAAPPGAATGAAAAARHSSHSSSSSSKRKQSQRRKQQRRKRNDEEHNQESIPPNIINKNTNNKNRSVFFRVGSRRAPNSPTRASNYGHVHDAVSRNFSAVMKGKGMTMMETSNGDGVCVDEATGYPLGVVGLRNLGNTCFLNSSLQCLSATIPLTDYFLGYDYHKELNKSNPLGTGGKLAISYAELMKAMWLGTGTQQSQNSANSNSYTVKPTSFKATLEKFAPQFAGFHQHDAQEFLALLLDGIHEDLNRIHKKPYIEDPDFDGTNDEKDAATAWKNYLQRDKSLIVDIFQGQLKNTRQCCVCRHVNIRFEPFMYLSVPISDQCRSLDDCLNLYLQEERLRGDNQWYCTKCKKHRDAIQKTTLWILPPILIVHLKRFKFNDFGHMGSKNTAPIDYPFSWDLTRYVQCHAGYSAYDLYAVSNHVGGMRSGHYTAYGKNRFDDAWYEFNDSNCRKVSEQTLQQNRASAYLLFYNRVDPEQHPQNQLYGSNNNNNIHHHPHYDHGSAVAVGGGGVAYHRAPLIRRQSLSRPDLWPHAQVYNNNFRDFTRQSARSMLSQSYSSSPSTTSAVLPELPPLYHNNNHNNHNNHHPYEYAPTIASLSPSSPYTTTATTTATPPSGSNSNHVQQSGVDRHEETARAKTREGLEKKGNKNKAVEL